MLSIFASKYLSAKVSLFTCLLFASSLEAKPSKASEISNLESSFLLISGSPDEGGSVRYPVESLKLESNKLTDYNRLATKQFNSNFVRAYHAQNLLLLGSMPLPGKFFGRYLQLNNPSKVNTFTLAICYTCYYIKSFILDKNAELIFMLITSTGEGKNISYDIQGFSFQSRKQVPLTTADIKFVYIHGMPSASAASHDMLDSIFFDKRNAIYGLHWRSELGWQLPQIEANPPKQAMLLLLNNNYFRAISSRHLISKLNGEPIVKLYIQNKNTNQWSTSNIPGQYPNLRAFDSWIATEERRYRVNQPAPKAMLKNNKYISASSRAYLGNFQQTGKMTLLNPIDKRRIEFDTKQADSEILLVDNERVFYRVNDELYRADIVEDTLKNTKLMVKDKRIYDVHWMMALVSH